MQFALLLMRFIDLLDTVNGYRWYILKKIMLKLISMCRVELLGFQCSLIQIILLFILIVLI